MSYSGVSFIIAQETSPGGGTYTTIAGQQDGTLTINNQAVDVTTKDSAGIRELLSHKVKNSISFSGAGVCKDSATLKALRDAALNGIALNFKITTPGDATSGVTYTGPFLVTQFQESGQVDGEWRFSASFENSAAITVAAIS